MRRLGAPEGKQPAHLFGYETKWRARTEEGGKKAYGLLLKTLETMGYGAIAQLTLHQRESTVIIRPYQRGLAVHRMYYPNEIRAVKEDEQTHLKDLKPQEIRLGEQFAKTLVKPFRPQEFRDEYQVRVKQLIESKAKGEAAPKQAQAKRLAPVADSGGS